MIVRYDKRGTGLSDRNLEDYSIDARVRDLEAVVDHLKLRKFSLHGTSDGGPVAIAYAARYPRRVSRLILSGTYASGALRGREESAEAIARLFEAEWGLASGALANVFNANASLEEQRAFASHQRSSASARDAAAMMRQFKEIDVSTELAKITAPTLVIHGRHDVMVPFEAGRELASKIRNARFFPREGGHGYIDEATVLQVRSAIHEFLADERPAKRRARRDKAVAGGPLTVLFTDIVGHAEMMQRLGDAKGREVLRAHERITRETLKQHGGAEVKTMGDGFLASFGSVTKAMDCAIALQRAFAAHTESMPEPLHVRVGLNAGEPIEEDGDLFGSTVILASRIAAKAGAGEILVPDTVRGLLSGKGFLFADRGDFLPKGFEDRIRLHEVRWQA
ncbi:MAG: adenylate/guanylate cyclase domain-containing protein [Chloroflexota bacterium]|nr:adenylate/guanylate cyclase domain-containing protein [Chloroflexota bacterium]